MGNAWRGQFECAQAPGETKAYSSRPSGHPYCGSCRWHNLSFVLDTVERNLAEITFHFVFKNHLKGAFTKAEAGVRSRSPGVLSRPVVSCR